MDLALNIEDRFGFRSDRVAETLGELWALAEGQLSSGGEKIEPPPPAWNVPPSSSDEPAVLGETIAEAFVRRVLQTPDDVSTADRISGVLSYRKLYVAARLMAKRFQRIRHTPRRRQRHTECAGYNGRPSARLGGGRYRLFRPAPGRQAAGAAELDDRPRQSGPCGEDAERPPRDHVEEADRPAGHPDRGHGVRLPGRPPRRDRQGRSGDDDALDVHNAGPTCFAVRRGRTSTRLRWFFSPPARRARPKPCR